MQVEEFGQYLKKLREAKGLTLSKLGDMIGYSNPYLSQIETGRRKNMPSPELLGKLAGALGVELSTLLNKAGYEDLYQSEKFKEAVMDFSEELDIQVLIEKASAVKHTLDLKCFLENDFKGFRIEDISPSYNGHELNKEERKQIITMIETMIPKYKVKKKGDN